MSTHQPNTAGTARAAPGTYGISSNDKRTKESRHQKRSLTSKEQKARKLTYRQQLVLFAIGEHERYGLELKRCIEECSHGAESISIGSLYPILHSLESKGLVSSRFGDEVVEERGGARRRYYSLTEAGISAIKAIQQYQSDLLTWQPS
jgi:PadR family transcriptional regulator PadR